MIAGWIGSRQTRVRLRMEIQAQNYFMHNIGLELRRVQLEKKTGEVYLIS